MMHASICRMISLVLAGMLLVAGPAAIAELPQVLPSELGFNAAQLARIDEIVEEEIAAKHLPGCVVAIGRTGGIGFLKAYGNRRVEPSEEPMTVDTLFDMASLTKPIATATSVMILVEQGDIRLRDPVAQYLPEFGKNGKDDITVEDLLVHRGGLIPDNSLKDYEDGPNKSWERICDLSAEKKADRGFVYSDVGFIVLGKLVEQAYGKPLQQFTSEEIFERLNMLETGYTPSKELAERAATTEKREDRWMRGEVHDPRAYLLEGVAGHAGLFSTAADLAIYCDAFLRGANGTPAAGDEETQAAHAMPPFVMSRATLAEMMRPREVAGNHRALGWDNRSAYSTNRGELLSSRAIGHGGFTGTAMWIDPGLDLFVIFLSNRVHPSGDGSVNPLAGRIGTVAAAAIDGPNASLATLASASAEKAPADNVRIAAHEQPAASIDHQSPVTSHQSPPPTLTGLDVLVRDNFKQLKGSRVGLITNHTGVDRDRRRNVDLLYNADGIELVAIFSPEHGIAGKLDHDGITDARDEATGLPIHSLYGETRKPTEKQLKGIDTLVFDIQDIGCRFYTYESTMAWAMEAAGEHGLKYVVLDRPNPIGGVAMEGPLADGGRESFVGCHTVPLRHGLTIGELAKMYRAEREVDVDLEVIKAENWRRGDYWDATGLLWINQSPNMRSLTEAILYPGMGVWETTNVSVGRGTNTPFEVLGAPWIDAQEFAAALNAAKLPGVRFTPIEFTPNDSKFKDQKCGGVNVAITNQATFEPVAVGMEIAATLRRLYPLDWQVKRADRLLINKEVFNAIVAGADRAEIETLYADDLEEFRERREEFLLYAD